MIQRISHTSVFVLDQDRAKAFYTEVLGFDLKTDVRMGDFRWLTVSPKAQPEMELILMPIKAGMMLDDASANAIRGLVEKGAFGGGVLETKDCKKTYEELKSRGATFLSEPTQRPYGIEATVRDDSGNWFSVMQRS